MGTGQHNDSLKRNWETGRGKAFLTYGVGWPTKKNLGGLAGLQSINPERPKASQTAPGNPSVQKKIRTRISSSHPWRMPRREPLPLLLAGNSRLGWFWERNKIQNNLSRYESSTLDISSYVNTIQIICSLFQLFERCFSGLYFGDVICLHSKTCFKIFFRF